LQGWRYSGGRKQGGLKILSAANTSKVVVIGQNGAARLTDAQRGLFDVRAQTALQPGDEIMVLPRIEVKSIEVTRAFTQTLYQMASTAKVAFGL
jgi:hypothetical protein